MTSAPLQILVVESHSNHALALREQARRAELAANVERCTASGSAGDRLAAGSWDVVVLSLQCDDECVSTVVGEIERHHPGLPLVVVAEDGGLAELDRASMLGPSGLVVAPVDLMAMLRLARTPSADAGFAGTCTGIPSAALLGLYCSAGHEGVLHLRVEASGARPERTGAIHIQGGQPVHASTGTSQGAAAVDAMLRWVEAEANFLPGHTRCPRTILSRWQGLAAPRMSPAGRASTSDESADDIAYFDHPEVVDKLSKLAHTPDVLGAYLMRHARVVVGHCAPELDERLVVSSLRRLAHVLADVEAQPGQAARTEVQATVGSLRWVVDRVGPASTGFQVGVVVRQASPVCKSLRRLLRQIDVAFSRKTRRRADRVERGTGPTEIPLRVA